MSTNNDFEWYENNLMDEELLYECQNQDNSLVKIFLEKQGHKGIEKNFENLKF